MFHKRLKILFVMLSVLTAVVTCRLWYIQISDGDRWQQLARATRVGEIPLPAIRGSLRDRDGVLLAQDRCAYTIKVFPSRFHEGSLLLAVRDVCVLLDLWPPDAYTPESVRTGPLDELTLHIARNPTLYAQQFLKQPADILQTAAALTEQRGERLGNPVGWGESGAIGRLRRCLAVIRGTGKIVGRTTFGKLSRHDGTLGDALAVTRADLTGRIDSEAADLLELGQSVGFEGLPGVFAALAELLKSEEGWIDEHVRRELRRAVFVEHLGTEVPTPGALGPQAWMRLARKVGVPRGNAEAIQEGALRVSSLLAGSLPDELTGSGGERAAAEIIVPERESRMLFSLETRRVTRAFFDQVRDAEDYDRRRYMSDYRERTLRGRLLGGRTWVFGKGARPHVADLVIGPGRLESIGFRLEPAFVREIRLQADSPSTHLLLGLVNSSGEGFCGAEEALGDLLRPRAGHASLHADGSATVTEPARHGQPVSLTLSVRLQVELERLLDERGAIAVLDARTGAILGLVSHPVVEPEGLFAAVQQRLEADIERTRLQRRKNRGDDEVTTQLDNAKTVLRESRAFHLGFENPVQCPPGSVFKLLTILMGLEKGFITGETMITCDRGEQRRYGCHLHGPLAAVGAIKHSCNNFCYQLGRNLGCEGLVEGMDRIGFFDRIPGLPDRLHLLRRSLLKTDAQSLAIGRADLTCFPVQAAGIVASIATGRVVRPHLFEPEGFQSPGATWAREENLAIVREGMQEVVHLGGTAWKTTGLKDVRFAGKTGTAELGFHPDGGTEEHDSWFVGYVPWDAPRYAIAVLQDHTVKQGADVAPLALAVARTLQEVFGAW